MLEKKLTIINKLGLHARASAKLVNLAKQFSSQIEIHKENKVADAKSILKVMMLAASKGQEVTVKINGPDAELALSQIEELINNRFGEAE